MIRGVAWRGVVWRFAAAVAFAVASAAPVVAQIEGGDLFSGAIRYNPRRGDDHGKSKLRLLNRKLAGLRDDVLWHVEAANVTYPMAGNASLLSASRLGLTERLEFSSYLLFDVGRPTLHAKILWHVFDKRWFLSSRINVSNAYPAMSLARSHGLNGLIREEAEIPLVFEVGHEALLSRGWFSDPNCSDGSVYLILTAGLGVYGGFKFNNVEDLDQAPRHFLANRGETLISDGFRGRLKFWADAQLMGRINVHGGLSYHFGSFTKHHAVELQLEGEYFFTARLSGKLGFLTSFANYRRVDRGAAIWPMLDVSYYFGGRNTRRQSSLFRRGIYKGSNL